MPLANYRERERECEKKEQQQNVLYKTIENRDFASHLKSQIGYWQ